jgi:Flp pilus assembly protein TadG
MRNLIPGVTRPLRQRRRRLGRDERGVVGVLVALLLGGGVLMGLGALVIDVGQLYQERAELQNGADAGSLAVAKSCATGTCTPTLAAQYANENASALTGNTAAVSLVCGSGILGACPASTGALTDCPAAPLTGIGYVDVHTSTKLSSGSTVLPASFAKALLGNSSYAGSTVQACAQAAWGGPSAANTLAFAISACSWDSWTSVGTNFAPTPPTVPSSSFDHQLNIARLGNTSGCSGEPNNSDGTGAFGWTVDQTGNCGIFTNTTTILAANGGSAGSTCHTALAAAQTSRKPVFVPVYTTFSSNGGAPFFTLKGFAAFVVTGYSLPSFSASDWLNSNNNSCSSDGGGNSISFRRFGSSISTSNSSSDGGGGGVCIDGYFTKAFMPATGGTGGKGQYLGAAVIGLSG